MKKHLFVAALVAMAASAQAQQGGFTRPSGPVQPASDRLQKEVGYEPKLGDSLPLDVMVTDETGTARTLGSFLGSQAAKQKPILLTFYYQSCEMLCSLQLESVVASLKGTKFVVNRDFTFLAVSMDPKDTVAGSLKAKWKIASAYGQSESDAGFHFVTGSPEAIKQITAAAGYRYYWEEETKQWAHPSGVLLLTPEGRMARFLGGIEPFPRDLQFALIEASAGTIGTLVDKAILYCYQYNESSGRYGAAIMKTLRLSGVFTVFGLAAFVLFSLRRERKAASTATPA